MKNIDAEVKKRKMDRVKYRNPDLSKDVHYKKNINKCRKKNKNKKTHKMI
jgi:hypothetical protein